MPILDKELNQEPTLEQKQERVKIRLIRQVQDGYNGLRGLYLQLFNAVWSNPQGLTPQQVFDALGNESVELFQLANLLLQTLEAAKSGSTDDLPKPEQFNYTINTDGTVTVNEHE